MHIKQQAEQSRADADRQALLSCGISTCRIFFPYTQCCYCPCMCMCVCERDTACVVCPGVPPFGFKECADWWQAESGLCTLMLKTRWTHIQTFDAIRTSHKHSDIYDTLYNDCYILPPIEAMLTVLYLQLNLLKLIHSLNWTQGRSQKLWSS